MKTNAYLVACDHTRKAALIDPPLKLEPIIQKVRKKNLSVVAIINTHNHIDHILGNAKAKKAFGAPLIIHQDDAKRLSRVSPAGWLTGHWRLSPAPDRVVHDGEQIEIGGISLLVIHTPGHTPGGICLRHKKSIFTGDTLFQGAIGRTDFKGSSYDALAESIKEKLFILSDDISCYPGHGRSTTLGDERKYNLFVRIRPEHMERLMLESLKRREAARQSKGAKESK